MTGFVYLYESLMLWNLTSLKYQSSNIVNRMSDRPKYRLKCAFECGIEFPATAEGEVKRALHESFHSTNKQEQE